MIRSLFICIFLIVTLFKVSGQIDLSKFEGVKSIDVKGYWGDINLQGTLSKDAYRFQLSVTYTNPNNKVELSADEVGKYVDIRREGNQLILHTREPRGFESLDLNINLPAHLFVTVNLLKGGEVYGDNLQNGLELNSRNGSVKLTRLGGYALVNAVNGEINAQFSAIDPAKPVSLVTMNGEVNISMPKDTKREVRLISRKNGYIKSMFKLKSTKAITQLNNEVYSKVPIIHTALINGGGALLFLSTENGPIILNQSKL